MKTRTALFASLTVLLATFALLVMLPASAQTVIPTITPIVIVSPTPTPLPPTLPPGFIYPSPSPTSCAPAMPLYAGANITLEPGVNLRNIPNLSGAVVNYYTIETVLTVLDGPVCAQGYNWWYVSGSGQPGWVVEGRSGRYFITLLPPPSSTCFPALNLSVGGEARMFTGVRVHEMPDVDSLTRTVALFDTTVQVLAGPICDGEMNWWYVRVPYGVTDQNAETTQFVNGWLGEGYPLENYWLEPLGVVPTPINYCPRALRLVAGDRAATTYSDGVPRSLRAAPSTSAAVIQPLIAGIAFDIIDGAAVCADGFNWWHVRLLVSGQEGWLAEGRPGNYWFSIIYDTDP
ncbi:MAG: SH3 type 3 domain protein [Chloroflexi bacterium OLB15]|nr:MAG: SH3 type 3 domain protein [Chloroflexi bacterium OLB15]